ncbi:MAG: M16 family metallopeptidase [Phycisphaerales bacterium]
MSVTFEKAVLPNGLTVIGEVVPHAHSSAVGFFVRAGARDEAPGLMGVSHFLEHMMFKGTARRSADDVNREFDEIGAQYNAYTSTEMTCFHAQTLPERLAEATDILGDILRPALRDADFDAEKGVILEEIAMYRDNPFWVLYEQVAEQRYHGHALGHRVLGTDDTIKAMRADQMREYFTQRYSADNTVVALAGKLDFDKVVKQIETLCGDWQTTRPTRDNAEPKADLREVAIEDPKITRAYFLMLAPAPAFGDDRRYAASILTEVLGGADNSRLHWALVDPGLAEEATAAYDAHDGCGDYFVYASCDPERLDEVRATIDKEIAGLVESLSQHDLDKLRNKIATGVTLAGERPGGRMQRIGRRWTYLREHVALEDELERIHGVTLDDLREVWKAYPFAPRTVGILKPKR